MAAPQFSISTLSLSGTLADKLEAIKQADFPAIELGALDLSGTSGGTGASIEKVIHSQLRISALQEMKDFVGHSGRIMAYKMELAKSYLKMMARIGCKLLIVTPSTSSHEALNIDKMAADLRSLATLAMIKGIKIGFKPLSWSPSVYNYDIAWQIVQRAGNANIGLVIDNFNLITQPGSFESLNQIPVERINLIQLSDFTFSALPLIEDQLEIARHFRLFPGEGDHGESVKDLIRFYHSKGYQGDYVFDVFNDKYLGLSPADTLSHAINSRRFLLQDL